MFHPSRGGVRGGRDQFDWEDIKKDKDRFNYLGNSLKAVVKKPWNQGPEADWYVKKDGAVTKEEKKGELLSEIEMIKAREKALMEKVLTKGFGYKHEEKIGKEPVKKEAEQEDRAERRTLKRETEIEDRTERRPRDWGRREYDRDERRYREKDESHRRERREDRDRRSEHRRVRSRSPSFDRYNDRNRDRSHSRRYR